MEVLTFNKYSLITYKSTYINFSPVHRRNYNLTYPCSLWAEFLLRGNQLAIFRKSRSSRIGIDWCCDYSAIMCCEYTLLTISVWSLWWRHATETHGWTTLIAVVWVCSEEFEPVTTLTTMTLVVSFISHKTVTTWRTYHVKCLTWKTWFWYRHEMSIVMWSIIIKQAKFEICIFCNFNVVYMQILNQRMQAFDMWVNGHYNMQL